MADQISDSVLDAVLKDDPTGRVACEVLVTTGICVVSGEITTNTYVDVPRLVRSVIHDIGYSDASLRLRQQDLRHLNSIQSQSPDIAMGVDTGGRGRPGPDVRLRLRRNAGTDAAADHAGPQAGAAVERSAARRQARLPAARTARARSASSMPTGSPSASTPWWFPRSTTTRSPPRICAPR